MTKENLIRLHKHFSFLAKGEFTERDFDVEYAAANPEDNGRMSMGKMSGVRRTLMIGDAKRHLADIESKNPWLAEEEKPVEEKKESKPKEKK